MKNKYFFSFLLAAAFIWLIQSCTSSSAQTKRPVLVCTTGIIADFVQAVVQDDLEVITLIKAGLDPHIFKPTPSTLRAIQRASIIVYNGLHLEGNLVQVFNRLQAQQDNDKKIWAVSDGLPSDQLIQLDEAPDSIDPHIWMDIGFWLKGAGYIVQQLINCYPEKASLYQARFLAYKGALLQLEQENLAALHTIPEQGRILITTHDAFSYFSRTYGVPVQALQGISTSADFGIRKVQELVDFIVENKVNAIFIESAVPAKIFQNIATSCARRGHKVKIAGVLYTDSLGIDEAQTYYAMQAFNVQLIVRSLL